MLALSPGRRPVLTGRGVGCRSVRRRPQAILLCWEGRLPVAHARSTRRRASARQQGLQSCLAIGLLAGPCSSRDTAVGHWATRALMVRWGAAVPSAVLASCTCSCGTERRFFDLAQAGLAWRSLVCPDWLADLLLLTCMLAVRRHVGRRAAVLFLYRTGLRPPVAGWLFSTARSSQRARTAQSARVPSMAYVCMLAALIDRAPARAPPRTSLTPCRPPRTPAIAASSYRLPTCARARCTA